MTATNVLLVAAALVLFAAPATAQTPPRETFAIDYVVTIAIDAPGFADVRWELSGAEEVDQFTFHAPSDRYSSIEGSGQLKVADGQVVWRPSGPYGHLSYRVRIDHKRGDKGHYDSFAGPDWAVTRARDLFPRVKFKFKHKDGVRPRARARLLFRLPSGWISVTPQKLIGPNAYLLSGKRSLVRPTGWIALGKIETSHQEVDDVMLRLARAPGSKLTPDEIYSLLADAIPRLRKMFHTMPSELLIVSAGDPMWRGGLSAYHSMFLHGDRPLRTPDKTAPVLHELFHVAQPFGGQEDADWIIEGLAEYYSLELQRRAGVLTSKGFAKGLEYFARYGLWNVDLRKQHDNAATNNSAPLVMYALDLRIQHETAGKKRLDDVVAVLSEKGGNIGTEDLRAAVVTVTGKKVDKFFSRHVEQGEMPKLDPAG